MNVSTVADATKSCGWYAVIPALRGWAKFNRRSATKNAGAARKKAAFGTQPCFSSGLRRCLGISSRMNQPPNAVRKEHIYLAGLDQRGNFTSAPNRMTHRLTGAIGARAIVRLAIH